jgi:energy-coupling factor transporter ATP-binding protein EcfA2
MTNDQKRTLGMLQPNFAAEPDLIVARGTLPEQLLAEIESSTEGKYLVAGQRGMGKTTELLRLYGLLQAESLPIFVQFGAQESITYPMLIDAMAQALFKNPQIKINTRLQKRYRDWFSDEDELYLVEEGSEGSASVGGEIVFLAGKKSVRHKQNKSKTKKTKILKGLKDLLDNFNDLIADSQKQTSRRIVFIVDDIDKIQDVSSIERTFIHSPHIIYSIRTPAIFTVPITYATSSSTRLGSLSYGGIYRVPAIEIVSQEGSVNASELDFMRQVLKRRMPYNPLPDELLDIIITYSGGVLVDAMRMVRGLCKRCILELRFQPDSTAVEAEFQQLVDDYKFAFENIQLWKKLARICAAKDKSVIMTDDMLPDLLYKMIVIEYRRKSLWFDLHPAVQRLYEQNKEVIDNLA